eukprot:scaffold465_cov383-Pavlova_lutheri.AAC.12
MEQNGVPSSYRFPSRRNVPRSHAFHVEGRLIEVPTSPTNGIHRSIFLEESCRTRASSVDVRIFCHGSKLLLSDVRIYSFLQGVEVHSDTGKPMCEPRKECVLCLGGCTHFRVKLGETNLSL